MNPRRLTCSHEWVPGKTLCEVCNSTGKVPCLACKMKEVPPHTCKNGRRRCTNCGGAGAFGALARCNLPRCHAEIPTTQLFSLDKSL